MAPSALTTNECGCVNGMEAEEAHDRKDKGTVIDKDSRCELSMITSQKEVVIDLADKGRE